MRVWLPADERFDQKWIPGTGGCWLWAGSVNNYGYGLFWYSGRYVMAHRFSYERDHGRIAVGLEIDHLCRVPPCVNPQHMEPVTARENTLRGIGPTAISARKTACLNGHPFTEENIYHWPPRPRMRMCRTCIKERSKRRRVAAMAARQATP